MPIHQIDGSYKQLEKDNMEKLLAQELETASVKSELSDLSTYIQIEIRDENWKYLLKNGHNESLKEKLNLLLKQQVDMLGAGKDAKYNMGILQATLVNVCENCGIESILTSYHFNIAGQGIDGHLGPNSLAAFAQVVKELKAKGYIARDYKFHGVLDDDLFRVFSSILDNGVTDKSAETTDESAEDDKTTSIDQEGTPSNPEAKEKEAGEPEAQETGQEQVVESKDKDKEKEVVPTEGNVEDSKEEKGSESGKETTKATSEVAASTIDVPARVHELEEAYKMSLIGSEVDKVKDGVLSFLTETVGNTRDDKKEHADFATGFSSLREQVMKQTNTTEAMKVFRKGITNILQGRAITTTFDEKGESRKTGEKLNIIFDSRKDIRAYLETDAITGIDALDKKLQEVDLVAMGLTDVPGFEGLATNLERVAGTWKEDREELEKAERTLAAARKKQLELIEEKANKERELKTVQEKIAVETKKIGTPAANDKQLKALEKQQKGLEDSLNGLGDGTTSGLIFEAAQDVDAKEISLTTAIDNEEGSRNKYGEETSTYVTAIAEKITARKETNKDNVDKELEKNAVSREVKEGDLDTKKTAITKTIEDIQISLDEGDDQQVRILQEKRGSLLEEKQELEKELEELDFADRIAYKREYEAMHTLFGVERQGLEKEEDVLENTMAFQKDRLASSIAGRNIMMQTEAKAQFNAIDDIKTAASSDINELQGRIVNTIIDLYGGHAGIIETITASDGTKWELKSDTDIDPLKTSWTLQEQGSNKSIEIASVDSEIVTEDSSSTYGKIEWNAVQQKAIDAVQTQLVTWKDYVDADMHVHVLQQRIDSKQETIEVVDTLIEGTQETLEAIDKEIGAKNLGDGIVNYALLQAAHDAIYTKYINIGGYTDAYYTNTEQADKEMEEKGKPYKELLAMYAPRYDAAIALQKDLQVEKVVLEKEKASFEAQLRGDPNYQDTLKSIDTKKDRQENELEDNMYRTEYAADLIDPEGRTNQETEDLNLEDVKGL